MSFVPSSDDKRELPFYYTEFLEPADNTMIDVQNHKSGGGSWAMVEPREWQSRHLRIPENEEIGNENSLLLLGFDPRSLQCPGSMAKITDRRI